MRGRSTTSDLGDADKAGSQLSLVFFYAATKNLGAILLEQTFGLREPRPGLAPRSGRKALCLSHKESSRPSFHAKLRRKLQLQTIQFDGLILIRLLRTVHASPAAVAPIERDRPGPGLRAHVLVSKYPDHLPSYHQSQTCDREDSIWIARRLPTRSASDTCASSQFR